MRSSHIVTLFDEVQDLVIVVNELLLESCNLYCVVFILSELELVVIIEQIVYFSAVDFVHGYGDSEVPLVVLPVVDSSLEQIFDSDALNAIHGVSFSRSSLTVREYGHNSLVENQIENWAHLVEIELFICLEFTEGIIEFEFGVLDGLGHAIHFVFAVMNVYLGVDHRDHIDLSISQLLVKHWPLLKAHADLHGISKAMRLLLIESLLFFLDHGLEVDIDLDALQLVIGFPFALELPYLFHFHPSGIPVYLYLVDFIGDSHFTGRDMSALDCHQGA